MDYIVILILLFVVVYLLSQPFRRRAFAQAVGQKVVDDARPTELIELEASRDAKYREIRDAELDHQTGKLSDADFDAINSTLRAEAIELLRQLDEFHARRGGVEAAREAQGAAQSPPSTDAPDSDASSSGAAGHGGASQKLQGTEPSSYHEAPQ